MPKHQEGRKARFRNALGHLASPLPPRSLRAGTGHSLKHRPADSAPPLPTSKNANPVTRLHARHFRQSSLSPQDAGDEASTPRPPENPRPCHCLGPGALFTPPSQRTVTGRKSGGLAPGESSKADPTGESSRAETNTTSIPPTGTGGRASHGKAATAGVQGPGCERCLGP